MPSLTEAERLALRDQLVAERAVTERQLSGLERTFDELVEGVGLQPPDDEHDPDGTTAYERAQVTSLAEATRAHLAEVDRALVAIEDEGFGACAQCGRSIGVERLQALPGVRKCVTCAAGSGGLGPSGASSGPRASGAVGISGRRRSS